MTKFYNGLQLKTSQKIPYTHKQLRNCWTAVAPYLRISRSQNTIYLDLRHCLSGIKLLEEWHNCYSTTVITINNWIIASLELIVHIHSNPALILSKTTCTGFTESLHSFDSVITNIGTMTLVSKKQLVMHSFTKICYMYMYICTHMQITNKT